MKKNKAVITAGDMATAYGWGTDACWDGLLSAKPAFKPIRHFDADGFQQKEAGIVDGLDVSSGGSRVMAMLRPLFAKAGKSIPEDSICLLATTLGEIEYLERSVLNQTDSAEESCPSRLLSKIERMAGLKEPGIVFSAACCSSTLAIAEGARMIENGEKESVLIAACDAVSEFLYAGFSSLLALDPDRARPFDQNREGLSIGEAAGYILLMSQERALRENRKILGEITGWGMSNDAVHMTGPSLGGEGLAKAIVDAMDAAGIHQECVASISAHGTGTRYNDEMEINAFKSAFKGITLPVYSMKGAVGHTMAAAGLIEVLIALRSLEKQRIPGTVGVRQVDRGARDWISGRSQEARGEYALSTNSGFGGINAALLLKRSPE